MTRLLHLRSGQGLYGADRALLNLATATGGGLSAAVGTLPAPGARDELGDAARAAGLRAFRFDCDGKFDSDAVNALASVVAREDFALLHAHDYKSLVFALLAAQKRRVPVVATYHGDTGASAALKVYEGLARGLGNLTHGVAAVSRQLERKLEGWVPLARVAYIPNGVPIPAPLEETERLEARHRFGVPDDAFVIATIGRLSVEKGHAVLVEALSSLRSPPHVLVAGDGPLRAPWESLAQKAPVKLLGFCEPRPVYAAADLVVMPSLTEGMPMVALEAMALGRPMLASKVGDLPELLGGGAGFLVDAGNAGALAGALEGLMRNRAALRDAGSRALERVKGRYSVETMAHAYAERLYAPALWARTLADAGLRTAL